MGPSKKVWVVGVRGVVEGWVRKGVAGGRACWVDRLVEDWDGDGVGELGGMRS